MTGMMARREGLPVEVLLEAPEVQNLGVLAAGGWHRERRSGREREREREAVASRQSVVGSGRDGRGDSRGRARAAPGRDR